MMREKCFFLIGMMFASIAAGAVGSPSYDDAYPLHAMFCAVTQKKKIGEKPERPWGHIALFLRGACRDRTASYPQLRFCRTGDADGSIVSVNSLFKNVNWMAIDGSDLAINGLLRPGQLLDQNHYDRVLDLVAASGAYSGIRIHEEYDDGRTPIARLIARTSVDIDFALNFGRNSHCARLPLNRKALGGVINYLNSVNELYHSGQGGAFRWDSIFNNCGHLVHNALAAIHVWPAKKVDASIPDQVTNLAIPANEVLELMSVKNQVSLKDPVTVFRNSSLVHALRTYNWLPVRHGILSHFEPKHEPNTLYTGDLDIFVFDFPFGKKRRRFFELTTDAQYQDVVADLLTFRSIYTEALANIKSERWHAVSIGGASRISPDEHDRFENFLTRYQKYLREQLNEVTAKLTLLSGR